MSSDIHPLNYSIHTRLRSYHLYHLLADFNQRGILFDIGCGLGYWLETLGKDFKLGVGLEYDMAALRDNCCRGLTRMVRGSADKIPLQEKSVDLVICSEVLEHLPDGVDIETLTEMGRILKPGGRLLITVPALEGINSRTKMRNLGHDNPNGGEYHYRMGYSEQSLREIPDQVPTLRIRRHRYSMFLISELFMDLQKWVFYRKRGLKEHSDIMNASNSFFFKVYRLLFPFLYLLFIFEDMIMCPLFKGHIHILELERT